MLSPLPRSRTPVERPGRPLRPMTRPPPDMTRPTILPHAGASAIGEARAPRVRTSAWTACPRARQPGAAKAQPKGLRESTRPIVINPAVPGSSARAATRLTALGRRPAPMTTTPPTAPTISRLRREADAPEPITTTRESSTHVARAAGARRRASPAAPQRPPSAHTSAGRRKQTAVTMPGIPAAPATASPHANDREGAIHTASARGSSVESTPVRRSGTRAHPSTVSAPSPPMAVAATAVDSCRPNATAAATIVMIAPAAQAAPITAATMIQTLRRRALKVSLHLRRMRVATTTGPPSPPAPRPAE